MSKTKLYKGKIEIEFDPDRHIFTRNDERILGVTSCTGIIDKSRPLIFWAVGLMRDFLLNRRKEGFLISEDAIIEASKLHQVKKEEAANIGTKIHDWVELWIKGKHPEAPTEPQVMNGVNAFLKWVKETKIKLKCSETIVYSKKHDFAGIMDAEGKMNGGNVIVDFKSSNAIYNEYRYQLAAYWLAREEETKKKFDGGWIIKFGKDDGEFAATYIPRKEYEKNKVAFLAALAIKRREQELIKESNK